MLSMLNGNELEGNRYIGEEVIYRRGSSTGGDRGDGKNKMWFLSCVPSFFFSFQSTPKHLLCARVSLNVADAESLSLPHLATISTYYCHHLLNGSILN